VGVATIEQLQSPEPAPYMALFYFDVLIGGKLFKDAAGMDLPDIDAAEEVAVTAAATIARDALLPSRNTGTISIQVRDAHGLPVLNSAVTMHTTRVKPPANTGDG
jgi:hypothetical protein